MTHAPKQPCGPLFNLFGEDSHSWPRVMIVTSGGNGYAFTRTPDLKFHISEDDMLIVSECGVITSAHKLSSVWVELDTVGRHEL